MEIMFLRRIKAKTRLDRISYGKYREELNVEDIEMYIQQGQVRCFGRGAGMIGEKSVRNAGNRKTGE